MLPILGKRTFDTRSAELQEFDSDLVRRGKAGHILHVWVCLGFSLKHKRQRKEWTLLYSKGVQTWTPTRVHGVSFQLLTFWGQPGLVYLELAETESKDNKKHCNCTSCKVHTGNIGILISVGFRYPI